MKIRILYFVSVFQILVSKISHNSDYNNIIVDLLCKEFYCILKSGLLALVPVLCKSQNCR